MCAVVADAFVEYVRMYICIDIQISCIYIHNYGYIYMYIHKFKLIYISM